MHNRGLAASVCGFLLCGFVLVPSARADVYHAVVAGETLASVAAKYGVSSAELRAANGLKQDDAAALGAMLLRVPGVENKGASALSNLTTPAAAPWDEPRFGASPLGGTVASPKTGNGFIARTRSETVRAGDSWEIIAARYQAAGYDVSADALRRRNNAVDAPVAGTTIVVPLDQYNYSAPAAPRIATTARAFPVASTQTTAAAQKAPPVITPNNTRPRALGDGVYAAGEAGLPVAKDATPTKPPIFGNGANSEIRGSLASRGGFGQLTRNGTGGEVRVLTPSEEAPAPRSSVMAPPDEFTQPVATGAGIARVANVALPGATIRRLPDASAAVLFKCQQNSQLAVLTSKGMWSAVLMSDSSTGWVPTKYLVMTDQTVDVSQQMRPQAGPGGEAVYSVGQYSTKSRTVAQALRWLGTPYHYGGTSRRGIDCSAMIQNSFKACGVNLPRTAAQQAKVGQAVRPEDLQPGDRLYFSASGTRVDHTGLYMGNGLFVHASGSGRRVMVSNLFQGRNWNIFVGARR